MSTLQEFQSRLKSRLAAATNAPRWQSAEAEQYMSAFRPRRKRFDETATLLIKTVIKPRFESLARLFPSARTMTDDHATRYSCWFAPSERFPVTAKVEAVVEHDESVEHLFVRFEANLMPIFFHFQPHDRLTLSLDQVDLQQVTDWLEQRIFEFLDTYLRHDRGAEDLEEDIVSDPVCGMRLRRSEAPESADYRGHAYFFCRAECREQFQKKPDSFVTFRTM